MKRVLLTGATGFAGRHAVRALTERGYDVHAATSRHADGLDPQASWHHCNLLDPADVIGLMQLVRPSHLLHFAWYVEHGKFWSAPENYDWLRASLDLVRRFAEFGGKRLIMAGTCAEYAWGGGDGVCHETTTPMLPRSLYGATKLSAHLACSTLAQHLGVSYASGRVFFPYGPGEPRNKLISSVIRSLLSGEVAKVSHGNQVRDWLYVQDVADAFAAVLDSAVEGPINIGSGQGVSIRQVLENLGAQLGGGNLLRFGAVPAAPDDPPVIVADKGRLNAEVGWSPRISLEDGLRRSVALMRAGVQIDLDVQGDSP